ncbi:MAG: FtsQ-type POTRA domain-containing protein [Syntrophomonadaceae bacterium]
MGRRNFARRFSLVLLALVALLSAYLFMHSSIFDITQIKVNGNEKVTQQEILALSGLTPGMNIFSLDEKLAAKSIEVHPMIKQAQIRRHLLSRVSIDVIERKVWAVIPFNELFLCIDDSGVCFDKLNNVPVDNDLIITLETAPEYVNLGQTVNAQATDMIKQVWQAMASEQHALISEIYYQMDGTLKIYTLQGTEVRFGNLERLDEKVKMFSEVLDMEKDMSKKGTDKLEYVDIRFKGEPVVKTKG